MKSSLGYLILIFTLASSPSESDPRSVSNYSYEPAQVGRVLQYPKDHGAHRLAAYEWWYFTGHQFTENGEESLEERAGFEITVFRISPQAGPLSASKEGLRDKNASFLIVNVAISDIKTHEFVYQSFATRERKDIASTANDHLDLRMPGLQIQALDTNGKGATSISLSSHFSVGGKNYEIEAKTASTRPLVLHGENGYSKKGSCKTCASHYSSFTRLKGSVKILEGESRTSGPAWVWFDHEFGSNALGEGQSGWDWFAIQLKEGWDLMVFQLRDAQGKPSFLGGTLVSPQGVSLSLKESEILLRSSASAPWTSPKSLAHYPGSWELEIHSPSKSLKLKIEPQLANQELVASSTNLATYWEGSCRVYEGDRLSGLAYLEMTGYDPMHRPKF